MGLEMCDAILTMVPDPATPAYLSVLSVADGENERLQLTRKEKQVLAETLAKAIWNGPPGETISPHEREFGQSVPIPEVLRDKLRLLTIVWLQPGNVTGAPNRGNVFVSFSFHAVRYCQETLRLLLQDISEKKSTSKADVLLVWYRDVDFWGEGEVICTYAVEIFRSMPFEAIYLVGLEVFAKRTEVHAIRPIHGAEKLNDRR